MSLLPAVLRQARRNLATGWLSQTTTLLTVSLAVLIFAFFSLIYGNMLQIGRHLADNLCLVAYLEHEPSPALEEEYRRRIGEFDPTAGVSFVSPRQARQRFGLQLGDDRDLLDDLPEDFLPASIEITPGQGLHSLGRLKRFSAHVAALPGVNKVRYGEDWLERFHAFIGILRVVVLLSALLLILTAVHMVSHTIRLTILQRREEFELQHLLGASTAYLSLPFLLESLLQGLLGSGMGLAALYLLHQWIRQHIPQSQDAGVMILTFFSSAALAAIVACATLFCLLGGGVALLRFLRR